MLFVLIKKEIISHILTFRFAVTFILILFLILAGFFVSVNEYRLNKREYASVKKEASQNLDDLFKDNNNLRKIQRLYWMQGVTHAIPVPRLSSLGQGISSTWPVAFNVAGMSHKNIDRSMMRNPLAGIFKTPDFIYIVNAILSLLAVLFIFDSVCGEKEAGTLRLMLSYSAPRHLVLISKWIGGYLVLLVPFLIASLGGITYIWSQGILELNGEALKTMILLIIMACLYFSVFFTLGLFISTVTKRSATALFICLFIWVLWILVIPNMAPVVGRIISPTPTSRKIDAEKGAIRREIMLRTQRLGLTTGRLSHGEEIKKEQEKLKQEQEYRVNQWDLYLKKTQLRQTRISETLGRFSPSASWIYAAFGLIGTGPDAYRSLLDARKRLIKQMNQVVEEIIASFRKTGKIPAISEKSLPQLNIRYPDVTESMNRALKDLLLLVVFNTLFFMAAFMFFLRYDVR